MDSAVALSVEINSARLTDFSPIASVYSYVFVMATNAQNRARFATFRQFLDYARANPGKLNFASSGYGLAAHLAGELFKAQAHIDIVHVPYKGSAPALEDVIAGQDQMMFATTSGVMGFLKNGQVRALAVTTLKRTPSLPDVPTMDEAGLPGFEATTWHGLVAPAGTPPQIVAALNKAIGETLKDPDIQHKLANLGIDIAPDTPAQFAAYIKAEIPKWAAVIKASGAKME